MRALLLVLALVAALSLGGCANTMAKVAPGPLTIRGELTVELTQDWNQLVAGAGPAFSGTGASEIWTTEGFPVDVLAFYVGVKEGEQLGRASGVGGKHVARFRGSMSPHEIVELYEAHATLGGSEFAVTRLAPAAFGGRQGFRFEFTLVRRGDSLPMSGIGYAAVAGGKLYLMTYTAPRSYFFPRHRPAVDAVAASARIGLPPEKIAAPASRDDSTRSSRLYGFGHPGATQDLEEGKRDAARAQRKEPFFGAHPSSPMRERPGSEGTDSPDASRIGQDRP